MFLVRFLSPLLASVPSTPFWILCISYLIYLLFWFLGKSMRFRWDPVMLRWNVLVLGEICAFLGEICVFLGGVKPFPQWNGSSTMIPAFCNSWLTWSHNSAILDVQFHNSVDLQFQMHNSAIPQFRNPRGRCTDESAILPSHSFAILAWADVSEGMLRGNMECHNPSHWLIGVRGSI